MCRCLYDCPCSLSCLKYIYTIFSLSCSNIDLYPIYTIMSNMADNTRSGLQAGKEPFDSESKDEVTLSLNQKPSYKARVDV